MLAPVSVGAASISQEKLGLRDAHTADANTYSTLMALLLVLISSVIRVLYMLALAVWASCSSRFLAVQTVHQH